MIIIIIDVKTIILINETIIQTRLIKESGVEVISIGVSRSFILGYQCHFYWGIKVISIGVSRSFLLGYQGHFYWDIKFNSRYFNECVYESVTDVVGYIEYMSITGKC